MLMSEYEHKVIQRYREVLLECTNRDAVNKAYRQARIWSRYHRFYGEGCTEERHKTLNKLFKRFRSVRLAELEGE